jgi:hypothetical protein
MTADEDREAQIRELAVHPTNTTGRESFLLRLLDAERTKRAELKAEIERLAALPDAEIDTSDAPELPDWSSAQRGRLTAPPGASAEFRANAALSASGEVWLLNEVQREVVRDHVARAIEQAEREAYQRGLLSASASDYARLTTAAQLVINAHADMQEAGGSIIPIQLHNATCELQDALDNVLVIPKLKLENALVRLEREARAAGVIEGSTISEEERRAVARIAREQMRERAAQVIEVHSQHGSRMSYGGLKTAIRALDATQE